MKNCASDLPHHYLLLGLSGDISGIVRVLDIEDDVGGGNDLSRSLENAQAALSAPYPGPEFYVTTIRDQSDLEDSLDGVSPLQIEQRHASDFLSFPWEAHVETVEDFDQLIVALRAHFEGQYVGYLNGRFAGNHRDEKTLIRDIYQRTGETGVELYFAGPRRELVVHGSSMRLHS